MADMPEVSLEEWIKVGKEGLVDAVVCRVYPRLSADGGNIEVVYLDQKKKAINEDVKWTGTHWEFAIKAACGGYADNSSRLQRYVEILRRGWRAI